MCATRCIRWWWLLVVDGWLVSRGNSSSAWELADQIGIEKHATYLAAGNHLFMSYNRAALCASCCCQHIADCTV